MTDYQVLISLNPSLTTASKLRDVQDEERNLWKWPHNFIMWRDSVTKNRWGCHSEPNAPAPNTSPATRQLINYVWPQQTQEILFISVYQRKTQPMRICSMNKHKWLTFTFTWVGCYYSSVITDMSRYYSRINVPHH